MPVLCHGPLREQPEHELAGAAVVELLRGLERLHPEIRGWILDERGRIRLRV
jgi:hypothetical protein